MHRKTSADGFIEVLILFTGLMVITAWGVVKSAPNIIASQPQNAQTIISSTPIPSPIPTVIPTIQPSPIHTDEAIGVGLTKDLEIQVILNGQQYTYPLLGIEQVSSESSCLNKKDITAIDEKITGKIIYVVDYNGQNADETTGRYVFLSDITLLNIQLISNGVAKMNAEQHPYYDEFVVEQKKAVENKRGIWSQDCMTTPTITTIIIPTLQPTNTIAPTPTNKPLPTKTPTPTKIIQNNIKGESTQAAPTVTPTIMLKDEVPATSSAHSAEGSLNPDRILQLINDHRKTKNLPPFEKDPALCKIAESRAPELYNEIYVTGDIHAGFRKRSFPFWITENMASYGSETANVNWWLNSPIHRSAIEGNSLFSCGACSGGSCVQLFTSYIPK